MLVFTVTLWLSNSTFAYPEWYNSNQISMEKSAGREESARWLPMSQIPADTGWFTMSRSCFIFIWCALQTDNTFVCGGYMRSCQHGDLKPKLKGPMGLHGNIYVQQTDTASDTLRCASKSCCFSSTSKRDKNQCRNPITPLYALLTVCRGPSKMITGYIKRTYPRLINRTNCSTMRIRLRKCKDRCQKYARTGIYLRLPETTSPLLIHLGTRSRTIDRDVDQPLRFTKRL